MLTARGVTPESLYAVVAKAFATPRLEVMGWGDPGSEPLDFGPLPGKFSATEGFDRPPPRSGGGVYHALCWIYGYALEYPWVMSALEKSADRGDLEAMHSLVGMVDGSHHDLRFAWYDASQYVGHWRFQLQDAVFSRESHRAAARRWAARLGSELAWWDRPSPTPVMRSRREAAWRAALTACNLDPTEVAGRLTEASLAVESAAELYIRAFDALRGLRHARLTPVLENVHRLEVAGNTLCASSALLLSPAYSGLYWRLLTTAIQMDESYGGD